MDMDQILPSYQNIEIDLFNFVLNKQYPGITIRFLNKSLLT